jgi:hypothetical protein
LKTLLGTATLLALGASVAFGQKDTTKAKAKATTAKAPARSQTRIPISKDAPGEVVRVKTDTVRIYSTDTLRVTQRLPGRVDTLRVTNTVTRYDTVQLAPPPMHLPGGLYFGIGGGVSAPNGAIFNTNSAGPSAQAQLGWQGADNPLGIRFDANYAQPGEDSQFSSFQGNPSIINLNLDLKLALPFFHHLVGSGPRFGLYAIGGGSYVMRKDLPIRLSPDAPAALNNCQSLTVFAHCGPTDWLKSFGYNVGGGASLSWGHKELFVESRIIDYTGDNSPRARQIPFILGINLY